MHLHTPRLDQKDLFDRLVQLYAYDYSEMYPTKLGPDGVFPVDAGFAELWTDTARHTRIMMVNDEAAGFGIVRQAANGTFHMEHFFVVRKFRRVGLGRLAAYHFFKMFSGHWSVKQIAANPKAQKFWRSVINGYTAGRYHETGAIDPIQTFKT